VGKTTPVLVLLLLLHAAACVRQTTTEVVTEDLTPEPAAVPVETRNVEVAYDDSDDETPEAVPVVQRPSSALHPPNDALFRLGAGYGALGRVDLAPCRNQGLQAGYLHMRVTFQESGRVARAVVESPVAPPPEALACVGEQLKLAMVPVFEGGVVMLSKSFFVN
jgi:hypothetical protein